MRKADVVTKVADLTGVPKVDVLVTLEAFKPAKSFVDSVKKAKLGEKK
jgi:hypothetical protein